MTQQTIRSARAFTLVETLVVVLIIGTLLAVTVPLYTSSQRDGELRACRANMAALFQAEETHRVRNRAYTNDMTKLAGMLGTSPKCPANDASYALTGATSTSITISCQGRHGQGDQDRPVCVNGSFTQNGGREGAP